MFIEQNASGLFSEKEFFFELLTGFRKEDSLQK